MELSGAVNDVEFELVLKSFWDEWIFEIINVYICE